MRNICAALERTQVVVLTCCFAGFVAAHRVGAAADNICATGKDPKVVALTCCFAGFIAAHRACAAVHNICAALERNPSGAPYLLCWKRPQVVFLTCCFAGSIAVRRVPLLCTTYALRWEGPQVVFLTCFAGRDPCRWCSLLVVLLAEWCSLLVALLALLLCKEFPLLCAICALLCKGPQAVFLTCCFVGFVAAHRDCAAVHNIICPVLERSQRCAHDLFRNCAYNPRVCAWFVLSCIVVVFFILFHGNGKHVSSCAVEAVETWKRVFQTRDGLKQIQTMGFDACQYASFCFEWQTCEELSCQSH